VGAARFFGHAGLDPAAGAARSLKQLRGLRASEEVAVISVGEDDDEHVWRTFTGYHQMTWRQSFDVQCTKANQLWRASMPNHTLAWAETEILSVTTRGTPGVLDRGELAVIAEGAGGAK